MTKNLPLMKTVLTSLAKSVLLPFRFSAGMSAADWFIQNKTYGSGTETLTISNEVMEYIINIAQSLEESGLLMKGISETIKNKEK